MTKREHLTPNGLSFLVKVYKQGGVLVGGSYDDARISRKLHKDGYVIAEIASSGSSFWVLTKRGVLAADPAEADRDRVLRSLASGAFHLSPLSSVSGADVMACRALARGGLAEWSVSRGGYVITDAGRAALAT